MLRMPFHYSFTVEHWYTERVLIATKELSSFLYSRARPLTTVFLLNIFARVHSRLLTRSKFAMATFLSLAVCIVVSCRLERLSLETCNARKMIAWGRCTPLTIGGVWYENQRGHWFHQSARSLTGEETEVEEYYDDENSEIVYMYGPIRHSYG